jgi:hypothetical protein
MHALCYGFGSDGLNRDSPLSDKAEVEKRQCQCRASGMQTSRPRLIMVPTAESLEPSTMWTSSAISFACVLVLVYILIVLRKETSWLTWLPDP